MNSAQKIIRRRLKMKKALALILSILALLVSVQAIDLDMAEAAEETAEAKAVLAEAGPAPDIAKYHPTYGELIYYENFEDGSQSNAYTAVGDNAFIWTNGNVVDNPVGEGKAFVSTDTYTSFNITGDYVLDASSYTICFDFLNYDGNGSNIPLSVLGSWLNPWDYWVASDISKTEWTTKTYNTVKEFTFTKDVAVVNFGGKGLYVDNIRVYCQYDLKDKAILVENDEARTIAITEKLPAPADKALNAWKNTDGKVWFAGAGVPAGETLYPCYSPIKYHTQYGELVYYEDFEDGSQSDAYNPVYANGFIWTGGTVVDNPIGSGKVFVSSETYTQLNLDGVYGFDAKDITICVDFLNYDNVSGSAPLYLYDNWLDPWDYWTADSFSSTEWKTHTGKKTLNKLIGKSNGASTIQAYFGGKGKYVDNIRIYVNHSVADKVRLAQSGDSVLYEVEGDVFTFPAIDDSSLNAWECKDAGLVFAPGEKASKADVLGKTFVAVQAMVYIDETLGELILLENFDDGTWDRCYTIGTNAFAYSNGGIAPSGDYGIGKYPTVFQLDNLGISAASKITVSYDYKFAPGKTKTTTDIWGSGLNAWGIALPSGGSETEWTKFSKTLSNASFGQYTEICLGLADLYVDNVAVYAVYNHSTGARFVESKFAPSTVVVPEGDTYTFGAPKNLMYNAWTDGEKTYLAGSKIAASDIVGKLYYPTVVEYAGYIPETEENIEFRVNGNSTKNGIRFKASIAPSKKADASEMGFIVARADVLADMEAELNFDLPAEGTVFLRGVAYDKDSNIIFGENDNGDEIFTAVCTGIDITSKTQVTTELSARPYMTISVSDGDAITVYGEVKTASYYSVANALKNAADNGDAEATALYSSAAYGENGNYIDDIINVAEAE